MKLDIPFLSQYDESVPVEWRPRACSITNLFMVLSYFAPEKKIDISSLIAEGESIGAYGPRGWIHEGIVRIAHNHGVHAYAQEFRSTDRVVEEKLTKEGVEKIKEVLTKGYPTIVSIQKENGSYHTITVIGVSDTSFICHDPEVGAAQEIPFESFIVQWRKLAIFLQP